MKRFSKILMFSILAVFLVAKSASAIPMLELSDGSTTQTIYDQDSNDLSSVVGGVTWIGAIENFDIYVTTGLTKPVIGRTDSPKMDLISLDVSGGDGGTLTIKWTDTDFEITSPGDIPQLQTLIGGVTAGTVLLESYLDQGNDPFVTATLLSSLGPFTSGAFSDSDAVAAGWITPDNPFSLTLVATITHGSGEGVNSSFNAEIVTMPEPASMLLLGSGLIGLCALGRRKFFKNS